MVGLKNNLYTFTQHEIPALISLFFNLLKKDVRVCILTEYSNKMYDRLESIKDNYQFVNAAHAYPKKKTNLISKNYYEHFLICCNNYDIVINLLGEEYITLKDIKIVQKMTDCKIFYLFREKLIIN